MKLPFTPEDFLRVFEKYNDSIWPLQIFFCLLAFVAIFFAVKKVQQSGRIILIILSFFWLWMGLVYHIIYFTAINKTAYVFGLVFIIQAILILYFTFSGKNISFRFTGDIYGITGTILMLFALLVYPLFGYLLGHIYPASPTFGLPCPTTIFTFGLFLWTEKRFPLLLAVIPLTWSIVGSTASFLLGIKEDTALLISGLLFLVLISARNKKYNKKHSMYQEII